MKFYKSILAAIVLVIALPVSAQVRFGVKVGTEVNSMHFDKSVFDGGNRAGFCGGLMLDATLPIVGIGLDASVLYVHRVNSAKADGSVTTEENIGSKSSFKNRDYIELPINFKYRIGLPIVGKIATPFVTTGPSFSFLVSKKAITEAYENKAWDVAWNFGLGVEVLSRVQIAASYGLGMTNTIKKVSSNSNVQGIDGKNNYWTITAAWLF